VHRTPNFSTLIESNTLDTEPGEIGNVDISCMKAVLGLAVNVLAIIAKCSGRKVELQGKSVAWMLVKGLGQSVNYTVELFHQFLAILSSLSNQ
jgi:hypothetical protein